MWYLWAQQVPPAAPFWRLRRHTAAAAAEELVSGGSVNRSHASTVAQSEEHCVPDARYVGT